MSGYVLNKLSPGDYSFRIRTTSLAGNGSWTPENNFQVIDPSKSSWGIHFAALTCWENAVYGVFSICFHVQLLWLPKNKLFESLIVA